MVSGSPGGSGSPGDFRFTRLFLDDQVVSGSAGGSRFTKWFQVHRVVSGSPRGFRLRGRGKGSPVEYLLGSFHRL